MKTIIAHQEKLVTTINESLYEQVGNTTRLIVRTNAYHLIGVVINGSMNHTLLMTIKDRVSAEGFDSTAIELVKDLI